MIETHCPTAFRKHMAEARRLNPAPADAISRVLSEIDYVYVAGDQRHPPTKDSDVIVYEKDTNHHGTGMNILFANGRVSWYPLGQANEIIGKNLPVHP